MPRARHKGETRGEFTAGSKTEPMETHTDVHTRTDTHAHTDTHRYARVRTHTETRARMDSTV